MIYTFYSFKGGVGRSMALANVAEWLYQQGLRVVIIDWDLEAPGLENFFFQDKKKLEEVRSQLGLIDLILSYKRQYPNLPLQSVNAISTNDSTQPVQRREQLNTTEVLKTLNEHLPSLTYTLYPIHPPPSSNPEAAAMWLLPAGWRAGEPDRLALYAQVVQSFDWTNFYTHFHGEAFFEWLRKQLLGNGIADVVLIDSRTGVTEMGGVCTRQLADIVVSFCVANAQNLEGIVNMTRSFFHEDVMKARQGRPLETVIVPTRLDESELADLNRFQRDFQRLLEIPDFIPSAFQRVNAKFWELGIHYVPKYAYQERLAIGDPQRDDHSSSLEYAYQNLATALTLLAPEGSRIRRLCNVPLRQHYGQLLPRIFIAASPELDNQLDRNSLRERLENEGILAWNQEIPAIALDQVQAEALWQQTCSLIDQSEYVLFLVTSNLEVGWLERIWEYTRRKGICIVPVSNKPLDAHRALPQWLTRTSMIDLTKDWQELIRQLQRPCRAVPLPLMAPALPANYLQRTEIEKQLKAALITRKDRPRSATLALTGYAGSGKTVVASAIGNDTEIQNAFRDGILWVALDTEPDIAKELSRLCNVLTGERLVYAVAQEASLRFATLLESRSCLLILDDLWDIKHLSTFYRGQKNCSCLITTRNREIALEVEQHFELGLLPRKDAIEMLSTQLRGIPVTAEQLVTLAERLGDLPLAINLAATVLKQRITLGVTVENAIAQLNDSLMLQGSSTLGRSGSTDRSTSFATSLELSLNQLSQDERSRFSRLADLPVNRPVTLNEVAKQWNSTSPEAQQLALKLHNLSLIDLNLKDKTIQIHPLIRDYLLQGWQFEGNIASTGGDIVGGNKIVNYFVSTQPELMTVKLKVLDTLPAHENEIWGITISPDGEYLFTASNDTTIKKWNLHTRKLLQTFPAHVGSVLSLAITPDSRSLISASNDRTLQVWDSETGTSLHHLFGHTAAVVNLAVTPDGNRVVSASLDKTLRVWDLSLGVDVLTLAQHSDGVNAVAVSPDGKMIISGSGDQTLKLWDVRTGVLTRTLTGHEGSVTNIALTPDGRYAVSVSDDRTIRVWSLVELVPPRIFISQTDLVWGVTVTPDGRYIISVSNDGTVQVRELASGLEVESINLNEPLFVCAISPDGTTIAVGGGSGKLHILNLSITR